MKKKNGKGTNQGGTVLKKIFMATLFISLLACNKTEEISRTYHKNGQLKEIIMYKNNELNGISKLYYEDGKLQREETYVNGEQLGSYKYYYPNGNLEREGTRTRRLLFDPLKKYYQNGTIKLEIIFSENSTENNYTFSVKEYYENGTLKEEGNFVNGYYEGIYTRYSNTGKLIQKSIYKDRKTIKSTAYYDDGVY